MPDYGTNPWRMGDDDVRFYVLYDVWAFRSFIHLMLTVHRENIKLATTQHFFYIRPMNTGGKCKLLH